MEAALPKKPEWKLPYAAVTTRSLFQACYHCVSVCYVSVCQAALGHGLAECVESEAKQWVATATVWGWENTWGPNSLYCIQERWKGLKKKEEMDDRNKMHFLDAWIVFWVWNYNLHPWCIRLDPLAPFRGCQMTAYRHPSDWMSLSISAFLFSVIFSSSSRQYLCLHGHKTKQPVQTKNISYKQVNWEEIDLMQSLDRGGSCRSLFWTASIHALVLIVFLVGVKLSLLRMSALDHFLASGKHGRISTEPVVWIRWTAEISTAWRTQHSSILKMKKERKGKKGKVNPH